MRDRACFALLAIVAALAFAPSAGAQVSVGHSGWSWGNPTPQGNTLHAVEFAGGIGYAAGDFGTLLRTPDGGSTWQGIATGIIGNLLRVQAIDSNTVVIGSGCVLRRSDDGGQTFHRLPFVSSEAACPAGLSAFHFPTPQTGYIVLDDGSVIRTDDGGQSFAGRTAVPGTPAAGGGTHPTDVFFLNPSTGFATAGGVLYRTTDGGGSWSQRFTGGHALNGLLFVDATTGYAVGDGNTLLKTTDGGDTWKAMPVTGVPNDDLTQIRCASVSVCLISTRSGDRVLRTTDGGTTVTEIKPSTEKIFAISFSSPTAAVGVGAAGATVASPDAGSSTATPSFTRNGSRLGGGQVKLGRLRATSASLVFATADNGRFARSTDGGVTWALGSVPTSEDLADISFVNQSTGYSLDVSGALRSTANGGATWTPLDTKTTARPSAVDAIDANTVLLVGPKGLRRATDGKSFSGVGGKVGSAALGDYDPTDGSAVIVYGPKSIFISTNKGASWKKLKDPVRRPSYANVDFVSRQVGYARMFDGRVFKTRNGGRKWTQLFGVGTGGSGVMSFGDAGDGFISAGAWGSSAAQGWVMRTSDGGATWRPQLIQNSPVAPKALVAMGPRTAFAFDEIGELFETTGGGDQGAVTSVNIRAAKTRLKKPATVKIIGNLRPSVVDAPVTVLVRSAKSAAWRVVDVKAVSGSGTFTTAVKVRRTSYLVAQWPGDADHDGDGSVPIKIQVGRK
jgi:photosystem II stability/assembly factor-like uncharacterized protein